MKLKRHRPRFQFRLRSLLLVMLTLAILFSASGRVLRSYHVQNEAREELVALGGFVQSEPAAGLQWLTPIFGDEYFSNVRGVALGPWTGTIGNNFLMIGGPRRPNNQLLQLSGQGDQQISDEDLSRLAALPDLERLFLNFTDISDAALVFVARANKLTDLRLAQTHISDAGLAYLAHLENLQSLDLFGTNITDAGIEHLAALPNLKRIDLRGTQVTDAGEEALRRSLPDVEILRRPLDGPIDSTRRPSIERQMPLRR